MKNKILTYPLLFLMMFSYTSCYKDDVLKDEKVIIHKDHPKKDSSGNLVGTIVDENGALIEDFQAILNDDFSINESSFYHFEYNQLDQNSVPLSIIKDNINYYFTAKPIDGEINYIQHTIFKNARTISKPSDQDLEIDIGNNHVSIKANAYNVNGSDFTGTIQPQVFIPDLQNPIHSQSIPGGHIGLDEQGNKLWLSYEKAISIDILSVNNTVLEIDKNQAFVHLEAENCSDCELWKYDHSTGLWRIYKSEKTNQFIKFEITTSGFFVLASSHTYNYIAGKLTVGNTALRNRAIDIYEDQKFKERIYTTNTGKWFTHLPVNKNYTAQVSVSCGDSKNFDFETTIEDKIIPTFTITDDNIAILHLEGEVKSCNQDAVEKHFLKIWQDEVLSCLYMEGQEVNIDILNCAKESIKIQSVDESWENAGPIQLFDPRMEHLDFSESYACNFFKEGYFIMKMDGIEKAFTISGSRYIEGRTRIEVYDENNLNFELAMFFSGKQERNYIDQELNLYFNALSFNDDYYDYNCLTSNEGCGFSEFNIFTYGETSNSWIKGEAKATLWLKKLPSNTAYYKDIYFEFLIPKHFN